MRIRVRALTLSAMLAAVSTILISASNLLPAGGYALLAVAAMLPAAIVIYSNRRYALFCYVVTAILLLMLYPGQMKTLLYAVVLGPYPVIKSLLEQIPNRKLELVCKLLQFNLLLVVGWMLYRQALVNVSVTFHWSIWIVANVVFLIYDYGFTLVIQRMERWIAHER